jgi:4-hydroxy-tetrahydrodipicolinate synthase
MAAFQIVLEQAILSRFSLAGRPGVARLEGTIVPLVTPFLHDERLDSGALGRLIEFALGEEASGLMLSALTGEGPLLDADETLRLWEEAVSSIAGRVPVVPTVISTTTRRAVMLVKTAERLGAAAVMVAPILPELYSGRSEHDAAGFFADVASATSLPLVLFNYPSLTGIDLKPVFVARLAGAIPSIAYIKESTGETPRISEISRLTDGRVEVICGAPQVALESLALGCRTWITGILNVVPRSGRQLMRAIDMGDLGLARRINARQILPTFHVIQGSLNPTGTIKHGLACRGIDVGIPRRPGNPLDLRHQDMLRQHVEQLSDLERAAEADLSRLTH